MDDVRITRALEATLAPLTAAPCPPTLAAALRHAVFPGGARLRPRLTLAIAHALGDPQPALADAGAVAVELLHAASLVHDDLPCFDDAALRRGQPTGHTRYGEAIAVLVGDGLIVAGFEALAKAAATAPHRLAPMVTALAAGVGAPRGIVAGQAWESEPTVELAAYHRAKTGALFQAAASLGALSAGVEPAPWARLGLRLGEAYQLADDLAGVLSDGARLGKGTGVDLALDRPSAVRAHGVQGALLRLERALRTLLDSIPPGPHAPEIHALLVHAGLHLVPVSLRGRLELPPHPGQALPVGRVG